MTTSRLIRHSFAALGAAFALAATAHAAAPQIKTQAPGFQGYMVGIAHVPFPGLGRLRAEGKGYVWVPLNYSGLK